MTPTRIVLALTTFIAASCAAKPGFDVIIRGGTVYDGTMEVHPQRADVGISGDRIAAIGNLDGRRAGLVIDARGKAVAPGFIDARSQAGVTLLAIGTADSHVRQGVTTAILADDTPAYWTTADAPPEQIALLKRFGLAFDWTDPSGYFERLYRRGTSINVGTLIPTAAMLRAAPGVRDRRATAQELAAMNGWLAGELPRALGVVVSPKQPGAVPRLDRADLRALLQARGPATALPLLADIPPGVEARAALDDLITAIEGTKVLASLRVDMTDGARAGTWQRMTSFLPAVPATRGFVVSIVTDGYLPAESGQAAEYDLREMLRWNYTMIGTGSAALRPEGILNVAETSPAAYGAFPRLLRRATQGPTPLSLQEAVWRVTGLPASRFRIADRGFLRPRHFADVVIVDPRTIADRASREVPAQYPAGIDYVLVNGVVTVTPRGHTGAKAGRPLFSE